MTGSMADRCARIAPIAFATLGAGYWLTLFTAGFPGDWALKAAPMLLAAAVLAFNLPRRFGVPMAVGFVFSAAGDVFLALDRVEFLMQGLLCFLVTQAAYSTAFLGRRQALGERPGFRLPVAVYGALLLAMMLPGLGAFLLPVFIYVSALVAMAALAAGFEAPSPGRVYASACLFVIADSLIGIDRFIVTVPAGEIVIVGCYTLAQYLIFTGTLRAFPNRRSV